MSGYLSGGRPVTQQGLWKAIERLASTSHSVASNIQRAIKRSMDHVHEFSGDPSSWYPQTFEELKEQRSQRQETSRSLEEQTGLIVHADA